MSDVKYKRVILKISGEALAGDKTFGLNHETLMSIAEKIKELRELQVEVAIVVGGGNFWRGRYGQDNCRSYGNACDCN